MKYISILTFSLILGSFSGSLFSQYTVQTFSGSGIAGLVEGPAATSQYREPWGMCRDDQGYLYLADAANNCIRRIAPDGSSVIYAGTGVAGNADGPDSLAQFRQPVNVCFDPDGNLLVADFLNHRIRMVDTSGMVSTIAGTGVSGLADGPDSVAQFNYPRGICTDAAGNIFVADSWNHRIRRVDGTTHEVATLAGGGSSIGVQSPGDYVDAADTNARFDTPCGITIDGSGNLYVADTRNHRIRMIDPSANVTTFAGSGSSWPGTGGFFNGPLLSAQFSQPTDLFLGSTGDLLISDTYNNAIRLISGGSVSTIAGTGTAGYLEGPGNMAMFNSTRGVVANDAIDSIWVADRMNHRIRLITEDPVSVQDGPGGRSPLKVWPQPAKDILIVAAEPGTAFHLTDLTGREIMAGNLPADGSLRIEAVSSGMYLLRLEGYDRIRILKE